ncbi:MAG: recombinase zinc beta ribbon domain-containing protein [Clostridia bacterium]|nr:recombinase zinc beta ribbon domain-containing protein [Clostridia bacterium]
MVFRTDTRSLLTGIIFCGHCGCRLCYNHQHEERKLASGGTSVYDYETYRCYRKISASRTCDGQSGYKATALNEAVEQQVRLFLSKLEAVPKERLVELASARNEETYKVAYKQAQKDFENAQKQVTALEEEAVKALTGESQLDLSIVNQMLLKHRAKLKASQAAMEEAQTRMQEEQENAKATRAQVDELLSWVECFEKADIGTKHLIVARLIDRIEVKTGYKVYIKFKISLKQFLGQE